MELFRQITANNIELKEYPFWKELAMEAYLLENESILKLDNQNFSDVTILDAEIALKKGKTNGDGRLDILAQYSVDYLAIVEIKLNEINDSSLEQLKGYLRQRQQIVDTHPEYWATKDEIPQQWIGVLVGKDISDDLRIKLSNGYDFQGIPIAGITLKRFRSPNNEIFVISDTFFNPKYQNKDYSKFKFNGQVYGKGKLVNAVIKDYVANHPKISYVEIEKIFPKSLQGSLGVFDAKDNAEEVFQRTSRKRHHLKADEEIHITDATIVTCSQWGVSNISKFIKHCQTIGLKIELD